MSRQPGAEAAFLATVERYRLPLYRYALRVAEDPALAEEAVQEALVRAWRAQAEGRSPERWGAWLYRVTHNVVVDEFRRRGHAVYPMPADAEQPERGGPEPAVLEGGPGHASALAGAPSSFGGPSPEEEAERGARRETVRRALALLPDRYRHVLLLREEEGLSYEEIAEVLGVEVGNVKVLLHRARASFASLYSALVLVRAAVTGRGRGTANVCPELAGLLAGVPVDPAAALADARLRRRVEQHLDRCAACLARREEYRRTGELFGLLPPVALPPSLVGWRPWETPQTPEGTVPDAGFARGAGLGAGEAAEGETAAGAAGTATSHPGDASAAGGASATAGGLASASRFGGLAYALKAKLAVLAGLAVLGASAAGIGYAVRLGRGGGAWPREPGMQVESPSPGPSSAATGGREGLPSPVPPSGAAGGRGGAPSPAPSSGVAEQGGEAEAEGGSWRPWGFRPGDRLRYRLVHHAGEGAKEGWFSLSLEDAGRGMLEARWEGEWEGRSFSLTQTGPPEAVAGPFSLLALSVGHPAAGAFLAAASGTLWAPWFMHFQGQALAPGTEWEFALDSGPARSVKVEAGCREAGWAGWLAVMRSGGKKVAETCLSPQVPLPLGVRLWDEDDGRLRYEAVALEYRPGGS